MFRLTTKLASSTLHQEPQALLSPLRLRVIPRSDHRLPSFNSWTFNPHISELREIHDLSWGLACGHGCGAHRVLWPIVSVMKLLQGVRCIYSMFRILENGISSA